MTNFEQGGNKPNAFGNALGSSLARENVSGKSDGSSSAKSGWEFWAKTQVSREQSTFAGSGNRDVIADYVSRNFGLDMPFYPGELPATGAGNASGGSEFKMPAFINFGEVGSQNGSASGANGYTSFKYDDQQRPTLTYHYAPGERTRLNYERDAMKAARFELDNIASLERSERTDQIAYQLGKNNATNWVSYVGNHFGSLTNEVGYNGLKGAVGLYNIATNSGARAQAINGAIQIVENPMAVVHGVRQNFSDFRNKSFGEQADSVFKLALGIGSGAGGAKIVSATGGAFVSGGRVVLDAAREVRFAPSSGRMGFNNQVGAVGDLSALKRTSNEVSALESNVEVRNGYVYKFDELNRVNVIEADLVRNPTQGRNISAQLNAGGEYRLVDDQGGHFIGRRFNGPLDDFNHFAQNGNFNMGAYKSLENSWDSALKLDLPVRVQLSPSYLGESLRPETLHVRYWIDGIPNEKFFYNKIGGQ